MTDLVRVSFALVNLPFTLFLVAVLVYWGFVILGAMGDGHSDGDGGHADGHLDGDGGHVDGHLDGDGGHADGHADGEAGDHGDAGDPADAGGGLLAWLTGILRFFHIGEVPITLALTVVGTCAWGVSMMSNHHFNPTLDPGRGAMLLVPDLIVAGFLAKILLFPLAPIFRGMSAPPPKRTIFLGKIGIVKTEEVNERAGQIEVMVNGISTLLNVRAKPGFRAVKGEQVVIFAHDEERGTYEVTRM